MLIPPFFDHFRHLSAAAKQMGATGDMRVGSLNTVLRLGGREVELQAQFLLSHPDGTLSYTYHFEPGVMGFIGWLPYLGKRWLEACDKAAFKRRCQAAGLPTPVWAATGAGVGDFVVKKALSSFGYGVRGPYHQAEAGAVALRPDEYAEQFVPGQIGKASFWNDRLVALELSEPACAMGDGVTPLAKLVQRGNSLANVAAVTDFMRFRGLEWHQVPADGERVVVDFKYGSPQQESGSRRFDRLPELRDSLVAMRLSSFGPVLWEWIPAEIRMGTLYTVDFVLSPDNQVWLLEMNCNPRVAPECYEFIVPSALRNEVACAIDAAQATEAPAQPAAEPPSAPSKLRVAGTSLPLFFAAPAITMPPEPLLHEPAVAPVGP